MRSHGIISVFYLCLITLLRPSSAYLTRNFDCGTNGFICEGSSRLRLCEGNRLFGPSFLCPANTICNEDSNEVCENIINHIDPLISKGIRCHRNERLADPTVPGCKGYVLCIPNKNRFQGIKFKCSGNTVFNGLSRTCSSPERYKCPLNSTKFVSGLDSNRRSDANYYNENIPQKSTAIDCKNYRFSVGQEGEPAKATYFCPSKPVPGERATRCTVFSNKFCITLERYDQDQFDLDNGNAYRKPRDRLVYEIINNNE